MGGLAKFTTRFVAKPLHNFQPKPVWTPWKAMGTKPNLTKPTVGAASGGQSYSCKPEANFQWAHWTQPPAKAKPTVSPTKPTVNAASGLQSKPFYCGHHR